MPSSYYYFKKDVVKYIESKYDSTTTILDVGPGIGTYSYLLSHKYNKIDCVEIFEPYIINYNLHTKYNKVFNSDILDLDFKYYDLIIMGDILEHISIENSQALLKKLKPKCNEIIIAVPWNYEQGAIYGNEHEIHLQPDLSREIMVSRYPELECIFYNDRMGVYSNAYS
jgi:predicted RNA methylase